MRVPAGKEEKKDNVSWPIESRAGAAGQVRVVLNKAHEVDGDRLIKVYGALMWSIGRCLRDKADVPKVYVGSFWDGPCAHGGGG